MEVFTKREISKMTNEEAQKHLGELITAYPLIFDQFTMLQEAAWRSKPRFHWGPPKSEAGRG
jgi:hypothetical protein